MKQDWITFEVVLANEMADAVANFCHEHGSGVMLEDTGAGSTRITAYFPAREQRDVFQSLTDYLASLRKLFPDLPEPKVNTAPLKYKNWAVTWKERFKPIHVGNDLIVTPPWIKPDSRGRQVIIIDPAEAFGTGTHETTQGCLILLEKAVQELKKIGRELTLLDVGCGSGILAIAGKKLGLKTVLGLDNDSVAVEAAKTNAALNGLAGEIEVRHAALDDLAGAWDIVTANLDPLTLIEHRDRLNALFNHFLIVSGVPSDQWPQMKETFAELQLALREEITGSEWATGLFVKRL